jgi:hypothetical protein
MTDFPMISPLSDLELDAVTGGNGGSQSGCNTCCSGTSISQEANGGNSSSTGGNGGNACASGGAATGGVGGVSTSGAGGVGGTNTYTG